MIELFLPESESTDQLGQALALTRPAQAVVHLQGDLGAGKSTLARALLRALGVQGSIRSPTYTLIERYPLETGEAWHLDLYRIGNAGELDFLGLDEGAADLWLVEWPERGTGGLPPVDLVVALEIDGHGRRGRLHAHSEEGHAWLERLRQSPHLQGVFAP
ncbi:tRNA (adenosine(37)-N6)-threonylcarbamoyltransferase complex ATPase subunit type 1 TsaE [Stenotrophomonas sp. Iso1]|uniref:tRNA (adenosine(37)-N6)-threonylcarbamoyltransferase complex ATPase subunit type 1 TsaE n=1 Tax=Stenotrophomonas sp. Iso1 TaxID=2977283 RepID=UPI0022B79793|nr:tRNA (adenosine(37)-N6)-threonylcarbamoyltransferase complex ATPase subunit type 1 TsaE [Stenotrophomonas sp. Iso1]